ncbi:unnamed protein product, partial [Didymodactylos carnosus]
SATAAPIYIATYPYDAIHSTDLSFESGDEFEFIRDNKDGWFYVRHLRTSKDGHIPKTYVELDDATPLRLAIKGRNAAETCLLKYNIPYAYLIRHAAHMGSSYALSVYQPNLRLNSLIWHYLIIVDTEKQHFYFAHEEELKNYFFKSFHELVNDPKFLRIIPLTKVISDIIDYEGEPWYISYDELKLIETIAMGEFGEVWSGQFKKEKSESVQVVVKTIKFNEPISTATFAREIQSMRHVRNHHLVTVMGVSVKPMTQETFLVTEFMVNGSLKKWLKNQPTVPDKTTIIDFVKHIICGMSHLELNNYPHRDLACRNILLGKNNKIKIANFGVSKLINDDWIPLRWASPELLDDNTKYSIKADIWAFGIVLIEMWLKGEDPYIGENASWVFRSVKNGVTHDRPTNCPETFYDNIIKRCFMKEPNARPSFVTLGKSLSDC